jgi:hypothetical protein
MNARTFSRHLVGAVFVVGAFISIAVADDVNTVRYYIRTLEQQITYAKEHPNARYAWQQCELTFQSLESTLKQIPEAQRTEFQPKIKEWKPLIDAGAARNRAGIVARRVEDTLGSAREEIDAKRDPSFYFDKVNEYLADPDMKALPADQMAKLKASYAELKRRAGK